jgi:hypothetical protein
VVTRQQILNPVKVARQLHRRQHSRNLRDDSRDNKERHPAHLQHRARPINNPEVDGRIQPDRQPAQKVLPGAQVRAVLPRIHPAGPRQANQARIRRPQDRADEQVRPERPARIRAGAAGEDAVCGHDDEELAQRREDEHDGVEQDAAGEAEGGDVGDGVGDGLQGRGDAGRAGVAQGGDGGGAVRPLVGCGGGGGGGEQVGVD